jgi:hypothetical protein
MFVKKIGEDKEGYSIVEVKLMHNSKGYILAAINREDAESEVIFLDEKFEVVPEEKLMTPPDVPRTFDFKTVYNKAGEFFPLKAMGRATWFIAPKEAAAGDPCDCWWEGTKRY